MLLPGVHVCLHMNFILAELTEHLRLLPRVCVGVGVGISPIHYQLTILIVGMYITMSGNFNLFPYFAYGRSVFHFLRPTLCSESPVSCQFLDLHPPSLPILLALRDSMGLEAIHPDPATQLPCDKHH